MSPTVLPDVLCTDEDVRRGEIEHSPSVQGIDYLEVTAGQVVLELHFIPKSSAAGNTALKNMLDDLAADPSLLRITGGERVRNIKITKATRTGRVLRVRVDQPGDFSTYELTIAHPHIDPPYSGVRFSFKANCPARFDCAGDCSCPERPPDEPQIDYLAKDYRSFRQALLDRLPTIAPDWVERHEADLGIVLLELLSYAGDQLSYQQDAVANEAYLSSARQRQSVRRHARLVNYVIDEGASARAFVVATVGAPCALPAPAQLLTRRELPFEDTVPPLAAVLVPGSAAHAEQARADADAVFETVVDAALHPDLNEIAIYNWDLFECCLPSGTTTADLAGDLTSRLRAGSFLVFEEIVGVDTGLPADADPSHRQVVRLTAASLVKDPLHPAQKVTRVTWDDADALAFPLCVSREDNEGAQQIVAVARGNVLVADHGESRTQWWPEAPSWSYAPPLIPAPQGLARGARATRFRMDEGPLSQWRPLGAEAVTAMDTVTAVPNVGLEVSTGPADSIPYTVARDLLAARSTDPNFVAEGTNDGRASIRFGDGVNGRAPVDGSFVSAAYRIGVGSAGNVGAEALAHLLLPFPPPGSTPPISLLRNPLPATGGRDPETIAQVKVRAPVAFRSPQLRAVTEADYAAVAMRVRGVSGAVARFRWTGSWLTVFLLIDAADRDALDAGLAQEIEAYVARFTQAGYDLEVRPANYVALDLELFVCVAPDRFRTDVEEELLTALSSRRLTDGTLGFFHPDRFSFGDPLYVSALYAAAAAVPGVESVEAIRFSRFLDDDPAPGRPATAANLATGVITVGDTQVLELLNDPSLPERGVLEISTGGGR
jgi:Baseplate J-like protein